MKSVDHIRINKLMFLQKGSTYISIVGNLIVFGIFYYLISFKAILWLGLNLIIFVIRLLFISYYKNNLENISGLECKRGKFENLYSFILFLSGFVWGLCIYVYLGDNSKSAIVLLSIFPMGAMVGTCLKLLLSTKFMMSYSVGILSSFCSFFFIDFTTNSLGVIFGLGILILSFYRNSLNSVEEFNTVQKLLLEKTELLKIANDKIRIENELNYQKEINAQNARLSLVGDMAEGVAHEINNPLTILKLNIEKLQKDIARNRFDPEIASEKFDSSLLTIDRIAVTIQGLLLFSSNKNDETQEVCNLLDVVEESLVLISEKLKREKIKLIINISDKVDVEINRISFYQVIINLVNNSFYYIKDLANPWIKIYLDDPALNDNVIKLHIKDSGINNIKNNPFLFDPFYSTKPIGDGAGMGLSISKGIIEKSKGTICVDMEQTNTCFTITLPKISS